MHAKELIAPRNEALAASAAPADGQPTARGWQHRLAVVATAVPLSGALVVWLSVAGVLNTTPTENAQTVGSASTKARLPPPDVDIARSFEIVAAADRTERTDEAAAVHPEPKAVLPTLLSWAADNDTLPMEGAQPVKAAPSKDSQAKASSQDREREQEARADRRWEERHARRLAAARKNVHRAPPPAPTESNALPIVPRESESWRGG